MTVTVTVTVTRLVQYFWHSFRMEKQFSFKNEVKSLGPNRNQQGFRGDNERHTNPNPKPNQIPNPKPKHNP